MIAHADTRLFEWMNSLAGKNWLLDKFVMWSVNDYFIPILMTLLMVTLWFSGRNLPQRERNQRIFIRALTCMGIANGFVKISNDIFFRPRPFVGHNVHMLFYPPTDSSFPSNGAAVTFALATAVFISNRKLGSVLYFLCVVWGFARVTAGVHYPFDILGGWAFGAFTTLFVYYLLIYVEPWVTILIRAFRSVYLA
jgi:undecaprenyl-diphosphatase